MSSLRSAVVLSSLLIPFSASFADDEETQLLHNNFYQQISANSCSSNQYCYITFPATTHVTTAITNVSCSIQTGTGTSVAEAYISTKTNTNSALYVLQPFYSGYHTFTTYFGVNGTPNLFVANGAQPTIAIYMAGAEANTTLFCTISGYHS